MSISFYLSICSIHLSTYLLSISPSPSISLSLYLYVYIYRVHRHITHRDTHTHIYIYTHSIIYPMSTSKSLSVFCIYLVFGLPCEPGVWGSVADRLTCYRWFAAEEVMASARKAEETFVQQLRAEVLCRLCCMGGGCLVEGIGCSLHLWDRLSKILW